MPRRDDRDRYGSNARLCVGHLSSRTRSRNLEHIFSKYGRFLSVYSSSGGHWWEGELYLTWWSMGVPRGPGGVREYAGRGPTPGSGRCFNCGLDGHWAPDCTAGDWKNKCYRCGDRGHIERNCQNSPKKPSHSRSPHKRDRDVEYDERRLMSPIGVSPEPKRHTSPSKYKKHCSTPVRDIPRERGSCSPRKGENETCRDGYSNSPRESPSPRRHRREREEDGYSDSPKETSGSPLSPATTTRYEAVNGNKAVLAQSRGIMGFLSMMMMMMMIMHAALLEVAGFLKQVV